jgi:hypothetical protein
MTLTNSDDAIRVAVTNPKAIARFNTFLDPKPNGCIEWKGYRTDKGYGLFGTNTETNPNRSVKAHRFAYALHYGFEKLPQGTDTTQKRKVLHHKCENKACVNPLHLEPVSDRWNLGRVNDKNMF